MRENFRNPFEIETDRSFEENLQRLYRGVRHKINREEFFRSLGKTASSFSKMVNDRVYSRTSKREQFSISQIRDAARILGIPEGHLTGLYIHDRGEFSLQIPSRHHDQLAQALGVNWDRITPQKARRIISLLVEDQENLVD